MRAPFSQAMPLPIANDPRRMTLPSVFSLHHVFGQMHIMNATIMSAGCLELLRALTWIGYWPSGGGRVTKFFSVPTVYVRLLSVPDLRTSWAAAVLFLARQYGKRDREAVEGAHGHHHSESYGLTEAMPNTITTLS